MALQMPGVLQNRAKGVWGFFIHAKDSVWFVDSMRLFR